MILPLAVFAVMILFIPSVESQTPSNAFLSNVIITPNQIITTTVHVGSNNISTETANHNNQSPFKQLAGGTYNISIDSPPHFILVDAYCVAQVGSSFNDIGTWDGDSTIKGVVLTSSNAHICTWIFEELDTIQDNVDQIAVQIQQTTKSIETVNDQIAAFNSKINDLESQKASLQVQIDMAKAELAKLQALLASL